MTRNARMLLREEEQKLNVIHEKIKCNIEKCSEVNSNVNFSQLETYCQGNCFFKSIYPLNFT